MSIVHLKRATIDSQHTIPYYNRHTGKEASKNLKSYEDDNIAKKYKQIFNAPIRDAEGNSIIALETMAFEENDNPNSIVNKLYNLDYATYRNVKINKQKINS